MPQPYNNAVITNAGLALLNKAQAGTAAICFTRMATGNGIYAEDEKAPSALRERAGLKSEKNSYALSSVEATSDDGVKLTALLTNQDPITGEALVSEGYYINEIGLYAEEKGTDGDTEALYSVAVAMVENGDYMPPFVSGSVPAQIVQEYHATVSGAANVTINFAGAAMLAEDAEKLLERLTLSYDEESGELQLKDGDRVLSSGDINPAGEPFDINEQAPEFEEASERENIASGERLDATLGKIEKFFNDLKEVAFTGSYNDLSNKPNFPNSLPANGGNADTLDGKRASEFIWTNGLAAQIGKQNFISYPEGGIYISGTGELSATGFLKIILPQLWTNTMIKFTVSIFNYVNNACVDYIISGRNYNGESKWYKCTALCIGKYGESLSNLPVNFGYIGDKAAIAIGYADTAWRFPQVVVHDVIVGYNNYEYEKWSAGWQVSIDATNITVAQDQGAVTNTNVAYNSQNSDTVDGFHASQGNVASTAVVRDSSGHTQLGYINSDTPNNENPAVSQVIVTNGSDNYYRKASIEHLKGYLGIGNVNGFVGKSFSIPNTSGKYFCFAEVTTSSWCNHGAVLEIIIRGVLARRIMFVFEYGSNADPNLSKFICTPSTPGVITSDGQSVALTVYMAKIAANKWRLYVSTTLYNQLYVSGFFTLPFAFKSEKLSSLPEGCITPTEVSYIP